MQLMKEYLERRKENQSVDSRESKNLKENHQEKCTV